MAEKKLRTDQDGQAPRRKTQQEVIDFAKAVAAILGKDFLDKPLADYATRVLAAIDQKPPEMNTAYWGSLLEEAATRLSIPFDAESFTAQVTALSFSEDTNPNGPTPSVAGFGTFPEEPDDVDTVIIPRSQSVSLNKDEEDEDEDEDEDEESTSGEIDILNDIGQELSAIQRRVTYILNLDTKQTEYTTLVALDAEINGELLDRISTVANLLRRIRIATEEADRYKRKIDQEIFPEIIEAEAHVQNGIFDQAKLANTDIKGRTVPRKSSYPFRSTSSNSGENRPSRTRTRKPKVRRTGGGQRTGK